VSAAVAATVSFAPAAKLRTAAVVVWSVTTFKLPTTEAAADALAFTAAVLFSARGSAFR
jgi:hypothetical protein